MSRYLILKLREITVKRVTVKVLATDWEVTQKERLIMPLNNASMSFKMLLISFHELSRRKYLAKYFINLFPPKT